MSGAAQAFTGWAAAAAMLAVTATVLRRSGRRRAALNEALHELRRPLQALALAGGPAGGAVESATRLAVAALQRLDREINGGPPAEARAERVACAQLLRSAVQRWTPRAGLAGRTLELRWRGGDAVAHGDRAALEQALDNLIVNAIEHGGPEIVVDGRLRGDRLVVSVVDRGRTAADEPGPVGAGARAPGRGGRRRRGHGLSVVRRIAAAHDGRFVLRHAAEGTSAVLELSLAAGRGRRPGARR